MTTPRRPPGAVPPGSPGDRPTAEALPSYAPRRETAEGSTGGERKEAEIRQLLESPHPSVPPDLAARAMVRGRRIIARRRARRATAWLLLAAAVLALAVTAVVYWRSGATEVSPSFGP
jgi:ferric-dicitrate binding protein FerR (iron transport regulator)